MATTDSMVPAPATRKVQRAPIVWTETPPIVEPTDDPIRKPTASQPNASVVAPSGASEPTRV
jgi:hypothetical protein